jgi:hypothetical protein
MKELPESSGCVKLVCNPMIMKTLKVKMQKILSIEHGKAPKAEVDPRGLKR